jgi:hypothetical protein
MIMTVPELRQHAGWDGYYARCGPHVRRVRPVVVCRNGTGEASPE